MYNNVRLHTREYDIVVDNIIATDNINVSTYEVIFFLKKKTKQKTEKPLLENNKQSRNTFDFKFSKLMEQLFESIFQ